MSTPDRDAAPADGQPAPEATKTVVLALAANIGVGLLKLAAGLVTGSAALLSEAAHSAGDSSTELLLLVAQRRSEQPADRAHPFGYGKERYFWSLLAAVAIFISGSAFSMFEGIRTIIGPDSEARLLWINYPVLAAAAVLEGISFRQAVTQLRREARRGGRSIVEYIRSPQDPTVNSVAIEDTTALIGIAVAVLGVALHELTGSPVWDGLASVLIGLLLLVAAFLLARGCAGLLIGRQADLNLVRAIRDWLEGQPDVDDVVDILTMMTGTDRVLLCARVDFVEGLGSSELEALCDELDRQLHAEFSDLDEIFIQPASRSNRELRDRVKARYGTPLADS
jgi:cation diffusion facilitator family transporter